MVGGEYVDFFAGCLRERPVLVRFRTCLSNTQAVGLVPLAGRVAEWFIIPRAIGVLPSLLSLAIGQLFLEPAYLAFFE